MPLGSIKLLLTTLLALVPLNQTPAQGQQRDGVELDIPFVAGGKHDQQLDLYTPAKADFPTILFVHEGSLISGDRKDEPYARMCTTFQVLGFGCAATNYRLAPGHRWPAQPNDVVSAFGWLKHNIRSRGGNPKRIFLFGHSSGCQLVAIVAADPRYLAAQGWGPTDIAGVVAMGCRLNDSVEVRPTPPANYESSWVPPNRVDAFMKEEVAFASLQQRNDAVPATYVTSQLPPSLILIADAERFFPPVLRDAAEFVGRAQSAGASADLAILLDRKHMSAIQMMVTPSDPAVVHVADFVRAHE
jgi:arylformamidase